MEELLRLLDVKDYYQFKELNNAYVCNLNEDKILIITQIEKLDDINELINRIPSVRNKIIQRINNSKNLEFVESKKIPMSKFLWDLYIIALHKLTNTLERFPAESISRYERDRFIARKIIIQYDHEKELCKEFRRLVFPHRELDEISLTSTYDNEPIINFEKINELLSNIDILAEKEVYKHVLNRCEN